ncbi:MAG: HDOD domain-containing protein [Desulfovibrionaceae bacterium]
MDSKEQSSACDGLFMVRWPVFERSQGIWGYELAAGDAVGSSEQAAQCVLGEALSVSLAGVDQNKMLFAPFTRSMLVEDRFTDLPNGRTYIQLGPDVPADAEVLSAVARLHEAGYCLALDQYGLEEDREPLARQADLLKLMIRGRHPREVIGMAAGLKGHPAALMAMGVDDWQTFEGVKALGFALYQGNYFGKPRIEPGRKLSVNTLTKIRILGQLLEPGRDLSEVAPIIATDPMLSYRLLRFINSAAFDLLQKVSTVEQAVNLLGMKALKQWAMFMVVADLDGTGRGEELTYLALQRGRFMEQCSVEVEEKPLPPQALFLAGLFSLLDALLGLPMREALRDLPVEEVLVEGLCGKPGWIKTWLDLVGCVEKGEWKKAAEFCEKLGLRPRVAAVQYLKASTWAGEHTSFSRAADKPEKTAVTN